MADILLFLDGLESIPSYEGRYGKGSAKKTQDQARKYAEKRGMNFEVIPSYKERGKQLSAAQARIKQGGVGAVLGFSAGGYTASRLKTPKGVEKIILGAPGAAGNKTFPGRHMEQVSKLQQSTKPQTQTASRFPPQPPPVSTGVQGAANRAAGLDSRLTTVGNYQSGGDRRRATLMQAAGEASRNLPPGWRVEAYSGQRGAGQGKLGSRSPHAWGDAVDFRLIDPQGRTVSNYQNPGTFNTYQKFAQDTHAALQKIDPALAREHRWGGYFSGPIGKGGRYGAMDEMHQDLGGRRMGMAAGSWEKGLNPQWAKTWGIADRGGMSAQPRTQIAQASNDIWKNPRGAEAITPGPAGAEVSEFEPGANWPTNKPQAAPAVQPAKQMAPAPQPAAPRIQTVEQLIAANQKNPAFAPYAGYAGLIPDQGLPADQWLKKHSDLLNSPVVPQDARQGIAKILNDAARPPQPVQQAPRQQPAMPQPRPLTGDARNAQPPGMAGAPTPQPPGQAIPMGGQPNNNMPIMGGSSMGFQQPINPQIQPGLGGGTPFSPMPQGPQSTQPSNTPSWMQSTMQPSPMLGGGSQGPNISTADMALPSNRGMMDMGGSFGGGFGGGMGGDAGGGGGGKRGGGVNMQAAMQMIPKPIQIQMPQVNNIKVNSPMQPGGDGGSLAQDIMQFLGGGQG